MDFTPNPVTNHFEASPRHDAPSPVRVGRRALLLASSFGLILLGTMALLAQPVVPYQADELFRTRKRMVEFQVKQRGISDSPLLEAMELVPRHLFLPEPVRARAYDDVPVGFAPGQSLPQAFVSARMIALLNLKGGEKVLEIGTGSGYDAALLSRIVGEVHTIEIDNELAKRAKRLLRLLGYSNVQVHNGDGYRGWPEAAPFDAILVTAAPQRVPEPLFDQLKVGGKMVVAVGFSLHQDLQVITKTAEGREVKRVSLINLQPMTGEVNQD